MSDADQLPEIPNLDPIVQVLTYERTGLVIQRRVAVDGLPLPQGFAEWVVLGNVNIPMGGGTLAIEAPCPLDMRSVADLELRDQLRHAYSIARQAFAAWVPGFAKREVERMRREQGGGIALPNGARRRG